MDKYGRVDTQAIRADFAFAFSNAMKGISLMETAKAATNELDRLIAVVEAADLYAADPSDERLALLNECLNALPQLAVKA